MGMFGRLPLKLNGGPFLHHPPVMLLVRSADEIRKYFPQVLPMISSGATRKILGGALVM